MAVPPRCLTFEFFFLLCTLFAYFLAFGWGGGEGGKPGDGLAVLWSGDLAALVGISLLCVRGLPG